MTTLKNERIIFWNESELIGMKLKYVRSKMNKKECSRRVPIRNVPLHREDRDPFDCKDGVNACKCKGNATKLQPPGYVSDFACFDSKEIDHRWHTHHYSRCIFTHWAARSSVATSCSWWCRDLLQLGMARGRMIHSLL